MFRAQPPAEENVHLGNTFQQQIHLSVGIQMAQAHFSPKSFYRLKIEVRHEFGSTNVLQIL